MTSTTEDKGTAATEISAATCRDKALHRMKLAQTCSTCGTAIPSLPGGYTPSEYQTFFAPPNVEGPSHPFAPDEQNAALWREYEVARVAYEDAVFAVDDAPRIQNEERRGMTADLDPEPAVPLPIARATAVLVVPGARPWIAVRVGPDLFGLPLSPAAANWDDELLVAVASSRCHTRALGFVGDSR